MAMGRAAGRAVLCPRVMTGANGDGRGAVGGTVSPSTSVGAFVKASRCRFARCWGVSGCNGMALALASAGFGVIATFITLFYDAKG